MIDDKRSRWIALLSRRPGPTMWSWPMNSSRTRGRILSASGPHPSVWTEPENKSSLTARYSLTQPPQAPFS